MPVWALLSAVQGPAGSGGAPSLPDPACVTRVVLSRELGFPGVGVRPLD